MSRFSTPLIAPLGLVLAILATAAPPALTISTSDRSSLSWPDETGPFEWVRPTEGLDGTFRPAEGPIEGSRTAFFVDQPGTYTIESYQEDFDGFIVLYEGRFDPTLPLRNAVAANDDGPTGAGTSRLSVRLAAGVIYHLATTGAQRGESGSFFTTVSGPGVVELSACFVGDEPAFHDTGDDLALNDFCVWVNWKDHAGNTGTGKVVGMRSDDSAIFWFFDPANWELLVKVLDGCKINGHYWVFYAATTDVEFDLHVVMPFTTPQKTYHNPLGHAADAVTDINAFSEPCP